MAQQSVSPLVSVTVMTVLLNVALMWTTPTVTLRRTFFAPSLLSLSWPPLGNSRVFSFTADPSRPSFRRRSFSVLCACGR